MKKSGFILALTAMMLGLLPSGEVLAAGNTAKDFMKDLAVTNPKEEYVTVYEKADESSEELDDLGGGQVVHILKKVILPREEEKEIWYKIALDDDATGYIRAGELYTGKKAKKYMIKSRMLYVSVKDYEPVPVYMSKEEDELVAYQLLPETVYAISGFGDEYATIELDNFKGYVHLNQVSMLLKEGSVDEQADARTDVTSEALKYLGNPYVWGGEDLMNGVDCSGYTMKIYEMFGVSLPHSSQQQSYMGREVSFEELQAGDLIFYGGGRNSVSHVAIYLGDGTVVHASNKRDGIKISRWDYRDVVVMRRYFE